jgi:hypothetical protein
MDAVTMIRKGVHRLAGVAVFAALCAAVHAEPSAGQPPGAAPAQRSFASAKEAADALVAALGSSDPGQLDALFGHAQSFIMVRDESGKRLYTVASHGFAESGVGSEVVIAAIAGERWAL